ncbi:hypothetical protein BJX65DRAFT_306870 [Aspergillus insuetus]
MEKPLGKLTLSAGIARINVGPDGTLFDVHLELLCDSSPYFNDLYKDRTNSAISDVPISLPDVDPDIFAEAISWMYRGKLSADLSTRGVAFCFELWVLAEKFDIPALQNSTIGICKVRIDNSTKTSLPSTQTIEYVYSNTKPASPPRRLLVDVWRPQDGPPARVLEDLCEALLGWAPDKNISTPRLSEGSRKASESPEVTRLFGAATTAAATEVDLPTGAGVAEAYKELFSRESKK